jgi:hypothetical protein
MVEIELFEEKPGYTKITAEHHKQSESILPEIYQQSGSRY